MRKDNPNIADLSDTNRPTKIAEKFSELYDNEWTEAYIDLTQNQRLDERKVVTLLYDIVLVSLTTEYQSYKTNYNLFNSHITKVGILLLEDGTNMNRLCAWSSVKLCKS